MQPYGAFAGKLVLRTRGKILRWTLIICSSRLYLFHKRLNKLINYDKNITLCFMTGLDSKYQILTGVKTGSGCIYSSTSRARIPPRHPRSPRGCVAHRRCCPRDGGLSLSPLRRVCSPLRPAPPRRAATALRENKGPPGRKL